MQKEIAVVQLFAKDLTLRKFLQSQFLSLFLEVIVDSQVYLLFVYFEFQV